MAFLEIDFDDIAEQIDKMSERFPESHGDMINIVLEIEQGQDRQDMIFGHPVEYRVLNKDEKI